MVRQRIYFYGGKENEGGCGVNRAGAWQLRDPIIRELKRLRQASQIEVRTALESSAWRSLEL